MSSPEKRKSVGGAGGESGVSLPQLTDERLICNRCGENGTVQTIPRYAGYVVACKRGREICCRTRCFPNQSEAIAAWEKMQAQVYAQRHGPITSAEILRRGMDSKVLPELLKIVRQACQEEIRGLTRAARLLERDPAMAMDEILQAAAFIASRPDFFRAQAEPVEPDK